MQVRDIRPGYVENEAVEGKLIPIHIVSLHLDAKRVSNHDTRVRWSDLLDSLSYADRIMTS